MKEELTIQEFSRRTGLSTHALRYYERMGLITPVHRASNGHRRYSAGDLDWISFLMRLRATGMGIRRMQAFAELRRKGPSSVPERLALLEAHHRDVVAHIQELEGHLAVIEAKIQHNRRLLEDAGKGEYADQVPEQFRL